MPVKVFDCLELLETRGILEGEDCLPEDEGSATRIDAPLAPVHITSFWRTQKVSAEDAETILRSLERRKKTLSRRPECSVHWQLTHPDIEYLSLLKSKIFREIGNRCLQHIEPVFTPPGHSLLSVACDCQDAPSASEQADFLLGALRTAAATL